MAKQQPPLRQQDRIEDIMNDHLNTIRLGDLCIAEANGPSLVPVALPNGQQDIQQGWWLVITLAHNKLVGMEPLVVSVPIPGLQPETAFLNLVTTRLLDEARKARRQAETPQPTANGQGDAAAMMAALRKQAGNE